MADVTIKIENVDVNILSDEDPETLSISSENSPGEATEAARIDHTHAIEASDNPGASSKILKTTSAGKLKLAALGIGVDPGPFGFALSNTQPIVFLNAANDQTMFLETEETGSDRTGELRVTSFGKSSTRMTISSHGDDGNAELRLVAMSEAGMVGIWLYSFMTCRAIKIGKFADAIDFVSFESGAPVYIPDGLGLVGASGLPGVVAGGLTFPVRSSNPTVDENTAILWVSDGTPDGQDPGDLILSYNDGQTTVHKVIG